MKTVRTLLVCAVLFEASAFAADPVLLGLVMPDAKAIAGVQVAQAKISPFGQYVLTHMQPDDAGFTQFMTATGFDPRRDLTEIVMASNATTDLSSHFLVVARGVFDAAKITAAARQNGGNVAVFMGVSLLSSATPSTSAAATVIAFPDNSTAIMGDLPSVQATIQRFLNKSLPSFSGSTFVPQVQTLSGANDFWFLTLVPMSEFSTVMPDANLGQAMNGNLFQAINQASGGVKFGANVQISIAAIARSDKDAQALVDVVRFIAGLIQTNKNAAANQIGSLLDTMTLNATGTTATLSLLIPEPVLEQLFTSAHSQQQTARRIHRHPAAPIQ